MQDPSATSTLIHRNRERLDSSEREHWSPAASKGHSCPNGSSSTLLPFFSHSVALLAGPCISIVSFWPCATLSQRMSLNQWEAPPKTAAVRNLVLYYTAAYSIKLLYSQHSGLTHQHPLLNYFFTLISMKIQGLFLLCSMSVYPPLRHTQFLINCTHVKLW